jgi:hypothetical protein
MGTKVRLAKFIADFNRTYGTAIPYNRALNLAVMGVIPAANGENGRWLVDPGCASAVAAKLGVAPVAVLPVAKDGIESPPSPCGPAATPVGTAPPKRRRRSAVTPEKTSPGKSTRSSSSRRAA